MLTLFVCFDSFVFVCQEKKNKETTSVYDSVNKSGALCQLCIELKVEASDLRMCVNSRKTGERSKNDALLSFM